jgi:hypothetical protein
MIVMGPITILQMGYREFTTRWNELARFILVFMGVIMVEGIVLDLFKIDATIGSNILLAILSVIIFRKLMGAAPNGTPYFAYFGNSLLIGLVCGVLLIPLIIVFVIMILGMFAEGFNWVQPWVLLVLALALPVSLGYFYLFVRLLYCLPGVAMGRRPYGFLEGWRDSKGVAASLVFASILASIIFGVVGMVIIVIFGIIVGFLAVAGGGSLFWVELIGTNLLAGILAGGWLMFLTVMQGTVYREHTHGPQQAVVDVF